MISLSLIHIPFACLMYQKGFLVLHGSAIKSMKNGITKLFIGASGVGKSTMAMNELKKGGLLITEDICIIKPLDNNKVAIIPTYPSIKQKPANVNDIDFIKNITNHEADGLQRKSYSVSHKKMYKSISTIDECIVLFWGDKNEMKMLSNEEGLSELMKYSIPPPVGKSIKGDIINFQMISMLIKQAKIISHKRKRFTNNQDN